MVRVHTRDDPPLVKEILVRRDVWADHYFVQMRGQCLFEKGLGVAVIWVEQANEIPARPIVAREKSMNLADVLGEGVETYSRVRYRADACFQPLPVSCFRSVVDDNAFPVLVRLIKQRSERIADKLRIIVMRNDN